MHWTDLAAQSVSLVGEFARNAEFWRPPEIFTMAVWDQQAVQVLGRWCMWMLSAGCSVPFLPPGLPGRLCPEGTSPSRLPVVQRPGWRWKPLALLGRLRTRPEDLAQGTAQTSRLAPGGI